MEAGLLSKMGVGETRYPACLDLLVEASLPGAVPTGFLQINVNYSTKFTEILNDSTFQHFNYCRL